MQMNSVGAEKRGKEVSRAEIGGGGRSRGDGRSKGTGRLNKGSGFLVSDLEVFQLTVLTWCEY